MSKITDYLLKDENSTNGNTADTSEANTDETNTNNN